METKKCLWKIVQESESPIEEGRFKDCKRCEGYKTNCEYYTTKEREND